MKFPYSFASAAKKAIPEPRAERPAKREVDGRLPWPGSVVEVACECGRSACAEVITLPWSVYEQAKMERRSVFVPGHELAGVGGALRRYDSFVLVGKV